MTRIIKTVTDKYKQQALNLVDTVFAEFHNKEEGIAVRGLVEEIRNKKYYIPELELIMVDENDDVIGYSMFSRFHIEGNYENELLLLTPVAVKTKLQRQHISKEIIEYGLQKAKTMGYAAVLVEGNPANYKARGFKTAADYGIVAGNSVHLPRVECLMICELAAGALNRIHGTVEYDFYSSLC